MLSLAIAPLLLLDLPPIVVPSEKGLGKPMAGASSTSSDFKPPKSLTTSQVEAIAKGFATKPDAKLLYSIGAEGFGKPGKIGFTTTASTALASGIIMYQFSSDVTPRLLFRPLGLKAGKKYVVVLKAGMAQGASISFRSSTASGKLTPPAMVPGGASGDNIPVAYTPKQDNDWFEFDLYGVGKGSAAIVYGLDVFSL